MGKKSSRSEEKKVRAADFSNFHTSDFRPTGLHQIFASFNNIASLQSNVSVKSESSTNSKQSNSQSYPSKDVSESQADILAILNKLTKKDSITKLKALETFNEILEIIPDELLEEFIVDLIHIFKKLAVVEPVKKIRLEFGLVLCKISKKLKKKLQNYLESFITYWWLSMHDESPDISQVYLESFKNLFSTTLSESEFELKTLKILDFYFTRISSDYLELLNGDMDSYTKEWLDTFGKASQNSATTADMHNRLFYSISHSLKKLFVYVRVHKNDYTFVLDDLINSEFVERVNEVYKSPSFKKKLACLLMLVEMVKVLPKQTHNHLESILSNCITCVSKDTEPSLIYHSVRLICACTRENNSCITWFLPNYDSLVILLLKNFSGGYSNKIDLYTLFPSLYMYLDPEYFKNFPENFDNVLNYLCDLMQKEVSNLKRNSYTFDLEIYRNLGTSMLCSFYKLLLLSKLKSIHYITLPFKKMSPTTENSRDFLWYYHIVLAEYLLESNLAKEDVFTDFLKELFSYSEDNTVLVTLIMDNVYTKLGETIDQVYPEFHQVYSNLLEKVKTKFLDYLIRHLENQADLSLDIDQMIQLLKKNPIKLSNEIPLIIFKIDSHGDFVEKYDFLQEVYKKLELNDLAERLEENLDDNLHLFYAAVLMETNPKSVSQVFDRKFDLQDTRTYYMLTEAVSLCNSTEGSDYLVQLAREHPNLDLLDSIFQRVDHTLLTGENKTVYEILLVLYQLYECKKVEFYRKYDLNLVESIMTLYLNVVLRKQMYDFGVFASFVLEEFSKNADFKAKMEESQIKRLNELTAVDLPDYEKFSKNLGSILGNLFQPDFVSNVLVKSMGFVRGVDIKTLQKRSYNIVVNLYLDSDDPEVKVEEFLDLFIGTFVSFEPDTWVTVLGDFINISTKYEFKNEEMLMRFMNKMLDKIMEEKYTTLRELNRSVGLFQFFYKTLRNDLKRNNDLASFIKSCFSMNLTAPYLLSAFYSVDTISDQDTVREIIEFGKFVLNKRKGELNKLEKPDTYTFLNYTTLVTCLLTNYKNLNKIGHLESEDVFKLFNLSFKALNIVDSSPHNHIDDRTPNSETIQEFLNSNQFEQNKFFSSLFTLFFSADLEETDFLWAHLSLFKFLSLFSPDIHKNYKDDIRTGITSSLANLYGSLTFHGVSTSLIATLINFQIEQAYVSEFHLRVSPEVEHFLKYANKPDFDLSREFNKLKISNHTDPKSLATWLVLCLKYGLESVKLDDSDSIADFSRSVSLLLRSTHSLQPSSFFVNVYAASLWNCRVFYPSISEVGVFCSFPNHQHVCIIDNFPEWDFFHDLNSCKIDFFKLLYAFNNYSQNTVELEENELDPEELTINDLNDEADSEVADLQGNKESVNEMDDSANQNNDEVKEPEHNIIDVKNSYDIMKLYFSMIIGPYLTSKIMRTYTYLEGEDSQEIEKCLICWLTVFNLHGRYKNLGNLNCANAMVKLLTLKPYEFTEYIDSFQDNLAEAICDSYYEINNMSFFYSDQFKLYELYEDEFYTREFYKSSLLDLFLQLLILCLEKMLIKDEEFCQTVKLVYYKVAKIFPMQVSEMWNNCKNTYVKKNIKKFTKHEVTQKLVKDELDTIKMLASDLTVFYDTIKREVTAKLLTKNEITAKITIKVPSAFPLEPLTFVSQEKKNHKWIMYSHSEANRSGITQGLLLWYNNVIKYYQGIDECPICYSIVHAQFQSIPTKSCKVCKYKFHKECLFKWFRNAAKAKCPLCQSQVSFL
ncbi:FANCL domain protein [Theileria parva strain Muguga]|uniref:E3 ubiquitin-protein ligase listerin n=1 Tax=Theileria parva TaxID=5875 RepID=Q4N3R9_THEPA|nr:FANCL domain protein [Theileria parva strain Muguga]EAN33204.1 FANCL domain protein [Theileria parva strain Muguga]|eukprot:XP_765487.1 hypothetical protein [Theileria parva strain Muguga]